MASRRRAAAVYVVESKAPGGAHEWEQIYQTRSFNRAKARACARYGGRKRVSRVTLSTGKWSRINVTCPVR